MLANLAAHLIVSEGAITTTEAKAKALRPYVEKLVTKAKHGGVHKQRLVVATIHDKDAAHRCSPRSGRATPTATAATRASSSSGPRPGDNAPMARIEFV